MLVVGFVLGCPKGLKVLGGIGCSRAAASTGAGTPKSALYPPLFMYIIIKLLIQCNWFFFVGSEDGPGVVIIDIGAHLRGS